MLAVRLMSRRAQSCTSWLGEGTSCPRCKFIYSSSSSLLSLTLSSLCLSICSIVDPVFKSWKRQLWRDLHCARPSPV